MPAAIEASGLTKNYGSLVAVDGVGFSVDGGVVLGVLGPNGAGKTTAIRMLTTILAPTSGSFSVAGVPHTRPREIRRLIGVLPESAGYPEQQTGEELLTYHGRLFGRARASARATATQLLEEVGLAERAATPIAGYSRGMRQRLGIARALVNEPRVVFLDEPTLGLDPAGQRQILGLVRGIARERGTTVLLSTHLLGEVEEVCERVLILNRGRIAADGTVAEVARRAAAPRSARLRVPAEQVEKALGALRDAAGLERVSVADAQPGTLTLAFADANDGAGAGALAALASGRIPVLAFELEGARLSDAFLEVTGVDA